MSTQGFGLYDPDDWRGWWAGLHSSETCDPELAVFALKCLEDQSLEEGVGLVVFDVDDGDDRVDVEVRYALRDYPGRGRVFHVFSIRSEGDPLPPSHSA